MGSHALVFGASGIQGWAIVNELLNGYPSPASFDRITAVANRPLTDNVLWPESRKLQIATGVDLLTEEGQDGLEKNMRDKIQSVETVTHLFFLAYIASTDPMDEISTNVKLLERAVQAVESLSRQLKFVVLFTGTKAYGVHIVHDFPFKDKLPLSEDLPRIPEPYASNNFYYYQYDRLAELSKDKQWTWCEIRPDVIVGFVPNNNFYCIAQLFATYLALFCEIHGEGAECPFPGTVSVWEHAVFNESSQDIIARFAIHCALHSDVSGKGQSFNISDNSQGLTWDKIWPIICEYFRLKGTPPLPSQTDEPTLSKFLTANVETWKQMETKYKLARGRVGNDRSQVAFMEGLISAMDFDRTVDLSKAHKVWNTGGRVEQVDVHTCWWTVLQRYRQARIIP